MNINYGKWHEISMSLERKFGNLQTLKMIENHEKIIWEYIQKAKKVLDLGAGSTKPLKGIVKGIYKSLDNDPTVSHDFSYIDQINETFDAIISNQFFEHLTFEEGISYFEKLGKLLEPGGILAITIPNIEHPTVWHNNWDHKAYWGYWDIGTLMELNYIEVIDAARYRKRPQEIYELTDEERRTVNLIAKIFSMDYCRFVLIVGRKR